MSDDLVYRLQKRAEIRRNNTKRKSVQNGEPDRISDLLEEAANRILSLEEDRSQLDSNLAYAEVDISSLSDEICSLQDIISELTDENAEFSRQLQDAEDNYNLLFDSVNPRGE